MIQCTKFFMNENKRRENKTYSQRKTPNEVVIMVYLFSGISIIIRSAVIKDVGHKNNESEVLKKK